MAEQDATPQDAGGLGTPARVSLVNRKATPVIDLDPSEFPFDKMLLNEILDRVARLHWAERDWLIRRIQHDMYKAGETR